MSEVVGIGAALRRKEDLRFLTGRGNYVADIERPSRRRRTAGVPLALFGAAGYGLLVGRIGGPFLVVQSVAPVALTYVAERSSDAVGLTLVAGFAGVALICFLAIRRPD